MSEKSARAQKRKRAKRCDSVLPDYDIHDQHVSNQPHHAHDGVESGDDNRNDDGVGVAVRAAAQTTFAAAAAATSHVGEARAVIAAVGEVAEAAAVVQRGELAPVVRVRDVACALHGTRCAESGRWEDTAADAAAAAAERVSPASATVVPALGLRVCARSVRPVLSVSVLKNAAARDAPRVLTNSVRACTAQRRRSENELVRSLLSLPPSVPSSLPSWLASVPDFDLPTFCVHLSTLFLLHLLSYSFSFDNIPVLFSLSSLFPTHFHSCLSQSIP